MSAESGRQCQCVLSGPGQQWQRFPAGPFHESRAVEGRERMPALPSGEVQVALALVSRGDREALRSALDAVDLNTRHVPIARELERPHVDQPAELWKCT